MSATTPGLAGTAFGLQGRNAIVLGGGLGMGEAVSVLLAELGADVAVVDLRQDLAEGVADRVRSVGRRAVAVTADVLQEDSTLEAFSQASAAIGPIELLANIVGMASWASAMDMTDDQWDTDFSRNLRYVWYAARCLARGVRERGATGAVVSVASMDGMVSAPQHAAYGAAKAGLISLTKTLAQEWAPVVRVNAVAPGMIRTPRTGALLTDEREGELRAKIPMRRLGTPDDIARVASFLLSDLASYVTGHTIPVDGGILIAGPFIPVADPWT